MNGGSRIVGLRGHTHEEAPVALAEDLPPPRALRVAGWLAALAAVACAVGVGVAVWPELAGAGALAWITALTGMAMGPLLIGIGWIAIVHGGSLTPRRFGGTARALRHDADALAQRLDTMLDRIGEGRSALTSQANALIAASDTALQRLSNAGAAADEQAAGIERSAARLTDASEAAVAKLDRLIVELPLAETRAVQIGRTLEPVARA